MKRRMKHMVLCSCLFLLSFTFSFGAFGSNNKNRYSKAYRDVISRFERKNVSAGSQGQHFVYNLIYIDNNSIPELVCENYWGELRLNSLLEVYTFHEGKAKSVFSGHTPQSFLLYYPKKNSVMHYENAAISGFGVAGVSVKKIKNGTFETYVKKVPITDPKAPKRNGKYKTVQGKYSKNNILKRLK